MVTSNLDKRGRFAKAMKDPTPGIWTPTDWLRYARKNLGEPGSEPFIFVSWASKDKKSIERALPFVRTQLANLKCPVTGEAYRLEHFMDADHGTRQGEIFPEKIAEWMWKCRGAILIWSQNYLDKDWGSKFETPSLIWRWKRHNLPLFIIHAGPTAPASLNVSVKIDGEEEISCDLAVLTHDRNPRENTPGSDNKYLPELNSIALGRRMVNISMSYAEAIAQRWHVASTPRPQQPAIEHHSPVPETTRFAVEWSGDFSSGQRTGKVFGREGEHRELTRHTRDPDVGVITVTALGGQGKTALVRSWIDGAPQESLGRDFEACFAFSFYHDHGQDEFAKELIAFLDRGAPKSGANEPKSLDLVERLRGRKILLFLDGLEVIQIEERQSEKEGRLEQGPVLNLLFGLCQETRECQSLAIVTSRLHLLGFEDYENSNLRSLNLGGLPDEVGNELLKSLGVRQISDAKRKEYCRDLAGHPLLLRVFAHAVRSRGGSVGFGNAAETIAEEMHIAEPGEFKDKLRRVVSSYRKELGPLERVIVTATAVFGGSATLEYIRSYIRQRDDTPGGLDAELIAAPLRELTEAGILTLREDGDQRTYSCHPSLREGFAPDPEGVRLAARISLYSRPAPMRPRSLAEAEPYIRAIRIHTEAGDFIGAHKILARHLDFGDVFDNFFGGQRALLDCFKQFLGPQRREDCERALGRDFAIAMAPRLANTAIGLGEWEEAAHYAEWDKRLLEAGGKEPDPLSLSLRAQIAAEIGEAGDARSLYLKVIEDVPPSARSDFILALADLERQLGAPEAALKLVRRWLSEKHPASAWIHGWNQTLHVLQYALKRDHPDIATRCHEARAAVMRAQSIQSPTLDKYIEYEKLSLKPRAARTEDDWQRQLKLTGELEADAKDYGDRMQGGWPIGRAEALGALGRFQECEALVDLVGSQIPSKSWRKLWLGAAVARVDLQQGKGAEKVRRIMHEAHSRERELLARDAAEVILEFADQISDRAIVSEAQQYLDRAAVKQRVKAASLPDLGPLPGEIGWEARVSQYILNEVRSEERDAPPMQEELDAATVLAAEIGSSDAILGLRHIGASPLAKNAQGVSALTAAAKAGHERAVEVLLKRTTPYDLENEQDLIAAAEAIRADQIGTLKLLLLAHGSRKSDPLNALLSAAAVAGSGRAVEALCAAGADPTALAGDLHPFVRAARTGNLDAVAALASRISDVNKATDTDGETALMAAMGGGHEAVVAWLLDRGADIDARDGAGRTATDYAIGRGQTGVLDVLQAMRRRDALAEVEPAILAVRAAMGGHIEMLKRAHMRGASMNDADQQGFTPLTMAAMNGHFEVIRTIRDLAPNLSVDAPTPRGWTAMMAAAEAGHNEMVTALRNEFGASLDIVDGGGWSALDHALAMGKTETIQLLISLGARPKDLQATASAVARAAEKKNKGALVAYLSVVQEAGFLDQLCAELWPGLMHKSVNPEFVAELLIRAFGRDNADDRLSIPTQPLEALSEEELSGQPCVYLDSGAQTYATLPLSPAPPELIERFTSEQIRAQFANMEDFDASRLRQLEIPWLGGVVAFLPSREQPFEVPLFVGEHGVQFAGRTNEWIYAQMAERAPPQADEELQAYLRFFFTTIVGRLGAFHIAEKPEDVHWLPDAADTIKRKTEKKLQPFRLLPPYRDGRLQMRGTVFFKNALFATSVLVAADWTTELVEEELLMEDLPVFFGQKFDLLVRK